MVRYPSILVTVNAPRATVEVCETTGPMNGSCTPPTGGDLLSQLLANHSRRHPSRFHNVLEHADVRETIANIGDGRSGLVLMAGLIASDVRSLI
jgi:hypothetical protein